MWMTKHSDDRRFRVLLVEDNLGDVFLFREALRAANVDYDITVINDGAEALEYVNDPQRYRIAGIPDLAVLDLNLPKVEGTEVLEALRMNPELADVPVAVLTSSPSPRDRAKAVQLGARRFITKPLDLDEFLNIGEVLRQLLVETTAKIHV
jgi:CheY-like chemotaxis protein